MLILHTQWQRMSDIFINTGNHKTPQRQNKFLISYLLSLSRVDLSKFCRGSEHCAKTRLFLKVCTQKPRPRCCRSWQQEKSSFTYEDMIIWVLCWKVTGHACTVWLCFNVLVPGADTWWLQNYKQCFPLWAIKYFHSGSLGSSATLKGAPTVVVKDREYLAPRISHPVSSSAGW